MIIELILAQQLQQPENWNTSLQEKAIFPAIAVVAERRGEDCYWLGTCITYVTNQPGFIGVKLLKNEENDGSPRRDESPRRGEDRRDFVKVHDGGGDHDGGIGKEPVVASNGQDEFSGRQNPERTRCANRANRCFPHHVNRAPEIPTSSTRNKGIVV